MSTPFPLEEEAQTDTRGENLANPNAPRAPGTWGGWGFTENDLPAGVDPDRATSLGEGNLAILYRGASAIGAAAANVEQLGGGVAHGVGRFLRTGTPGPVTQELAEGATSIGQKIDADARERLRALTPDPATSGAALQTVHGLVKVGSEALMPAGALVAGGAEGYNRFRDLREQGVGENTAAEMGLLTGAINAAGVKVPMSLGSTLAQRLASGAAANTAFGFIGRSSDAALLRAGGYDEMADQEHTFDMAQIAIDAITGAAFGGVAHLHAGAEANVDAALTANLALRNRKAAPGVAVDPAAAGAHADALNKAIQDLQDGRHVDVAGTGVEDASFLGRGGEPNPEITEAIYQSLHESGLLDEQEKLQQLDEIFKAKLEGKGVTPPDESDQHIGTLPEGTRQKLVDMYREAADAKPVFDKQVGDLATELGAEAKIPEGLKSTRRAVEKTMGDYDGDASQVRDLLRATIKVPTGDKMVEAAQAVRDRFQVVSESNRAQNPGPDGYRDVMFKVRTANGHVAEVQINLPSMLEAKGRAHDLYEARSRMERKAEMERRDFTPRQRERWNDLNAQMKAIYDPAWAEATRESNSSSETGMPLRETEPGGNQRGPEGLSNARKPAPPSALGTSATGKPSTLNSLEPGGRVAEAPLRDTGKPPTGGIIPAGEGKAGEENPVESSAREAVAENPDMKIATGDDKSMPAADALTIADGNLARTKQDAPSMFKAAIDCFLRRG